MCYKYTVTAICISVVLTCESMHAVTVCFTATLHTSMAIKSSYLHFELWISPALCTESLCNTVFYVNARKYLFRLCQISSFFVGYLSDYLPGFSCPSVPTLCFVLCPFCVVSFSSKAEMVPWKLLSTLLLFSCQTSWYF